MVSKVVDENITDKETIKIILDSLKNRELNCALKTAGGHRLNHVRILDVASDTLSFLLIQSNSSLTKTIEYDDLEYLEVNTQDDIIVRTKPGVSRGLLLDPSSDI